MKNFLKNKKSQWSKTVLTDGASLYQKILKSLNSRASEIGQSLQSICQEIQPSYSTVDGDHSFRRFLHRFGRIRSTRPGKQYEQQLEKLLEEIEAEINEPTANILTLLKIFSGVFPSSEKIGICVDEPLCNACGLREQCAFYQRRPTLKELPEQERPRERLLHCGEDALSAAELLGIIIRDGTRNQTAVDLGKLLLHRYGDLRSLSNCSIAELCEVVGIGPAKAAQIKAALAIGRRLAEAEGFQRGDVFCKSEDVYLRYHTELRDQKREVFKVILLDRKNRFIKDADISIGSLSASIVHPREVLNPAVKESASAIICVHNHPSGDPKPSREDFETTNRLLEATKILGISLLDHIVIGDDCYFSFADEGHIQN